MSFIHIKSLPFDAPVAMETVLPAISIHAGIPKHKIFSTTATTAPDSCTTMVKSSTGNPCRHF